MQALLIIGTILHSYVITTNFYQFYVSQRKMLLTGHTNVNMFVGLDQSILASILHVTIVLAFPQIALLPYFSALSWTVFLLPIFSGLCNGAYPFIKELLQQTNRNTHTHIKSIVEKIDFVIAKFSFITNKIYSLSLMITNWSGTLITAAQIAVCIAMIPMQPVFAGVAIGALAIHVAHSLKLFPSKLAFAFEKLNYYVALFGGVFINNTMRLVFVYNLGIKFATQILLPRFVKYISGENSELSQLINRESPKFALRFKNKKAISVKELEELLKMMPVVNNHLTSRIQISPGIDEIINTSLAKNFAIEAANRDRALNEETTAIFSNNNLYSIQKYWRATILFTKTVFQELESSVNGSIRHLEKESIEKNSGLVTNIAHINQNLYDDKIPEVALNFNAFLKYLSTYLDVNNNQILADEYNLLKRFNGFLQEDVKFAEIKGAEYARNYFGEKDEYKKSLLWEDILYDYGVKFNIIKKHNWYNLPWLWKKEDKHITDEQELQITKEYILYALNLLYWQVRYDHASSLTTDARNKLILKFKYICDHINSLINVDSNNRVNYSNISLLETYLKKLITEGSQYCTDAYIKIIGDVFDSIRTNAKRDLSLHDKIFSALKDHRQECFELMYDRIVSGIEKMNPLMLLFIGDPTDMHTNTFYAGMLASLNFKSGDEAMSLPENFNKGFITTFLHANLSLFCINIMKSVDSGYSPTAIVTKFLEHDKNGTTSIWSYLENWVKGFSSDEEDCQSYINNNYDNLKLKLLFLMLYDYGVFDFAESHKNFERFNQIISKMKENAPDETLQLDNHISNSRASLTTSSISDEIESQPKELTTSYRANKPKDSFQSAKNVPEQTGKIRCVIM